MVFSSLQFIFIFLPLFYGLYILLHKKVGNVFTLIASGAFYIYGTWNQPEYIALIGFSIVANYFFGRLLGDKKWRKFILILGLVFHFAWLIIYKYSAFFIVNFNRFVGTDLPYQSFILPLGISFYTFQEVSYLIDVYRGNQKSETNFVKLSTYILMFPQLIAGPIVNYSEIYEQLKCRSFSWDGFNNGLRTFTLGLASKVLMANRVGGLWTQIQTYGYESITTPMAWMGIVAYSLQIYFDFNGYSLMAIGLGEMMGLTLPKNFDYPYYSLSMTEFWRRWHITLGRWFREYVYIPLGGSRKGKARTILNLFVVWALTGLWHGANWNFVLWGLFLFVILTLEKILYLKYLERFKVLGHIYMALLIPLSWLLFAVNGIEQIKIYLLRLFPVYGPSATAYANDYITFGKQFGPTILIGLVLSQPVLVKWYEKHKTTWWMSFILLALFWGSVYYLYIGMDNPFLYFNF